MIGRDDLRAGVSAGILSEAQAASLASLADSRRGARENLAPGDEPFELFRGFNEIFIVVGLAILATGWIAMNGAAMTAATVDVRTHVAIMSVIGAGVLWLLSEYFISRRRMVAPAIALSILFAANAGAGFVAWFGQLFMLAREEYSSLPWPLMMTTAALFGFWLRFRVPFAMAMIAVGFFAVAILLAAISAGQPDSLQDLFLLSADGPFAWITLLLGGLVFLAAMWFDMSDPHRVTRRSANGFWLHIVAAPALVNTLALTLLERADAGAHLLLLAVLGFFAVVAIVIDRRSFLIAAIGYSVTLAFTILEGESAGTIIFGLGVVLLVLGALWERFRARLIRLLPFLPLDRLPPSN
ncbi:hypothetical protein [Roseovarius salis]|uniref:hypothetical protein n=1 Tax=Roseovarius salis TaxID=3376063 RepID=UPI0037C8671C